MTMGWMRDWHWWFIIFVWTWPIVAGFVAAVMHLRQERHEEEDKSSRGLVSGVSGRGGVEVVGQMTYYGRMGESAALKDSAAYKLL